MTREEKIALLKDIINGEIINPAVRKNIGEWAIKALEQEPKMEGARGDIPIMPTVPKMPKKKIVCRFEEQEPCEDCISRQAVLDIDFNRICLTTAKPAEMIREVIGKLPSVKQEPKTGHWIYNRTRDWDGECKYECSECGMGSDVDYAYCMRCGAKMGSEVSE